MANETDQMQTQAPPPPAGTPATHVPMPGGRAAIDASGLEEDQLAELLHLLVLCRYFDERMETLYRQGRLPGAIYSGRGRRARTSARRTRWGPTTRCSRPTAT